MFRAIAVSGYKNSGKTVLIERLVNHFAKAGLKTAVIKHDGHSFEPDREGTDSRRFFDAGACGTAVFDGEKYQIVKRERLETEEIEELFPNADIILLEGFKNSDYPKIWIGEAGSAKNIIAWVGTGGRSPCFDRDDTEKIGEFILEYIRRQRDEYRNKKNGLSL